MHEYRTDPKEHTLAAILGWALVLVAIAVFLMTEGRNAEFIDGFGPSIAACILFFGIVFLFAGRHICACQIIDSGLTFRSFRRNRESHVYWKTSLPWDEIVEIRTYKQQDHQPAVQKTPAGLTVKGERLHAKEWIHILMIDQLLVIDEQSQSWLFGNSFVPFWTEVFAQAKQEGIPTRLTFLAIDDHPDDFPEGLPVRPLSNADAAPRPAYNPPNAFTETLMPAFNPDTEVLPAQLKKMLDEKTELLLLDVRQPREWSTCHLEGAKLIPLDQLESQLHNIDEWEDLPVIVYCHHGARSLAATMLLRQKGFKHVHSLAGGIEDWSLHIDPAIRRY